jgi:hypothetical protein
MSLLTVFFRTFFELQLVQYLQWQADLAYDFGGVRLLGSDYRGKLDLQWQADLASDINGVGYLGNVNSGKQWHFGGMSKPANFLIRPPVHIVRRASLVGIRRIIAACKINLVVVVQVDILSWTGILVFRWWFFTDLTVVHIVVKVFVLFLPFSIVDLPHRHALVVFVA